MAKARAKSLTAQERKDIAKAAINARWDAYYKLHPDKLKAKLEREAKQSAPLRSKQKATK